MIMDDEQPDPAGVSFGAASDADNSVEFRITLNEHISAIPADAWDRCAGSANPLQSLSLIHI